MSITASSLRMRPRGTSRALRLALAPGRDLHQHRDLARLAQASGEPAPGIVRIGLIGLRRGEDRHLLGEPFEPAVLFQLGHQRLVDLHQMGHVRKGIGQLRVGERAARPVGEAGGLVDLRLGEIVGELLVGHRVAVAADHGGDLGVEQRRGTMPPRFQTISRSCRAEWKTFTTLGSAMSAMKGSRLMPSAKGSMR